MSARLLSLFLPFFALVMHLPQSQADDIFHGYRNGLPKADRVIVYKSLRELVLFRNGVPLRTFRVALGRNPVGPKTHKGDGRTPEGRYVLDWRNQDSEFYRSIHISYPSPSDVQRAQSQGKDPGAAIMIHGLPLGLETLGATHAVRDWTEGCIAVTNEEMDILWQMIDDGTPIELLP